MSDQSRGADIAPADDDLPEGDLADDAPDFARLDYDALLIEEKAVLDTDDLDDGDEGDDSDLQTEGDDPDSVIGEEDDNPFMDSDSALPDDEAEAAMRDEMAGTGIHFDPDDRTGPEDEEPV